MPVTEITRACVWISALGVTYVAASVEHVGAGAQHGIAAAEVIFRSRAAASRPRRGKGHKSVPVKELAFSLPQDAWHTVTWREGSTGLHALTRARGTPAEPVRQSSC